MNSIHNLDLNLLKSLQALFAERHVGRAAQKMLVTQSAMSHALRRLRDVFNDPLLVRVGNSMELTPQAEQLKEKVDTVFSDLTDLVNFGEFVPESLNRTFRVDAHNFALDEFLAGPLQEARKIAPKLKLELNAYNKLSFDRLYTGNTDLVVASDRFADPNFRRRLLAEETLVCILDRNHPALKSWSADSLFSHPHIALRKTGTNTGYVEKFAQQNGYPINVGVATENLHQQLAFLPNSDLIGFCSELAAKQVLSDTRLVKMPLPFEIPKFRVCLLWSERNQNDPAHRWLRNLIAGPKA